MTNHPNRSQPADHQLLGQLAESGDAGAADTRIGALWRQAVWLSELADKLETQDNTKASREVAQILDRQAGELEEQIKNIAPVSIDDVRIYVEMLSWKIPCGDEAIEKLLNPTRLALRALCGSNRSVISLSAGADSLSRRS